MSETTNARLAWLKVMYIWTIVVGGGFGLAIVVAPGAILSMANEACDPFLYGIEGSVYLAFGLLSILGLRAPLRFVPVLLLQLVYAAVWLIGVVLPLLIATGATPHPVTAAIFALTVVGDLIAIPFPAVLGRGTVG
jgi:hypothetical protein